MAKGTTEKMWRKALLLTAALVFVGFGAVVISLFRWQIVRGEEMSIAALDQSLRSTTLSAMRGTIYDATGKVLAQSASVWTVVLEPAYFADYDDPEGARQKVASGLAAILDMDEEEVYEKTQGSSYFVYLKRRVETSVRDEINEFLEAEGISSGVRLIEDYKRYYPYGTVASTVLGFTGTDGQGLEGLELQYDTQLRGTAGRLISSRNALGTDMPFEYEQYVEAQDGNNLVLTIDETVQSILEKYLAEGVDQFNVKNGAVAIMMDVNTGAILGLATTPTYDPNDPFTIYDEDLQAQIDALSGEEQDQAFNDAQLKQWRNKAVSDTYYPGSVFKMCTYAMGLEEGVVTEQTTYTCTGSVLVDGWNDPIHCWRHSGHGLETFRDGLCNSCNPYTIYIGQLLGGETFAKYREAFGFTESTGIDLPGEAVTLYHSAIELINTPSNLAVESFGQNFSITPLHMITAAASIANGGYLVTPHVVDRVVDQDGNIVQTADTSYRRQVISEETSAAITDILQQNVESGSATGGYVAGYRICGKTGTSEKVDKWNEDRTQDMEYIASYCGFAPAEDPQYALLVFFDEPDDDTNGGYNGGNAVAGPYFAKMMEEILPYLGVEAQYNEEEYANLDTVAPTVTGLTLEEAYAKLEEAGLTYSVIGDESDSSITVTAQVPEAGGAVPKDGQVVLYTNGYDEASTYVTVPNFLGYDVTNASYLASINGLQISVSGSSSSTATVTAQSVAEGEQVQQGTVITLTFVDNANAETGATAGG
ncbi:MAG: penicillin-binding transpeptidase domain-containing protein [Acutalibacter sp.]